MGFIYKADAISCGLKVINKGEGGDLETLADERTVTFGPVGNVRRVNTVILDLTSDAYNSDGGPVFATHFKLLKAYLLL